MAKKYEIVKDPCGGWEDYKVFLLPKKDKPQYGVDEFDVTALKDPSRRGGWFIYCHNCSTQHGDYSCTCKHALAVRRLFLKE